MRAIDQGTARKGKLQAHPPRRGSRQTLVRNKLVRYRRMPARLSEPSAVTLTGRTHGTEGDMCPSRARSTSRREEIPRAMRGCQIWRTSHRSEEHTSEL